MPGKKYDLEERTTVYAETIRDFALRLPKNKANDVYVSQLIRSGSSPGANYIEANEAIGLKDFDMKIKTCRREAKESAYWLRLVITDNSEEAKKQRELLQQEARGLVLIFSAILRNKAKTINESTQVDG